MISTSGNLEHEFAQKASILLANLLPNGRFDDILVISLWVRRIELPSSSRYLTSIKKLKDLEFEQKVAQAENEADLEKVLKITNRASQKPSSSRSIFKRKTRPN